MSKLIVFLILVLIIFPKPAYSATTPVFSTYLGGVNEDYIRDVAIDSQGNIYITGGTDSDNFPTTQGAYDRTYGTGVACAVIGGAGVMDVFVTKLTPSGQIIWSTYLGGPCYDRAYGIEVDSQGYVYLTGRAGRGFPTTSGTFQPAFNGYNQGAYGEENAFVAKISPDGSQLVWASYFGTNDGNRDLALDQNGDIFVASYGRVGAPYNSSWFTNAYQNFIKAGGSGDLAVAKIKSDGTQVLAATYFGGTGSDGATPSIRVDSLGRPVVLSVTNSTDLPTVSAYDSTFNGANDMYIVKFNSNLSQPIFSTYLGGTGQEFTETHGLALDSQDNVIIGVTTTSPTSSIPIIGGIQTTYGGSGGGGTGSGTNYPGDGYVAKFSSTGSFLASTYYGGNFGEGLEGIGVDSSDNIYFSGATYSTNFPITSDALFTTNRGSADFFTVKLSPNLDQRLYSSYIGGSSDDYVRTSMADSNGNFYIAGQTLSSNFYTLNAYDSTYGGNALEDAVLIKLSTGALSPTSTPQPPTTTPTTPLPSVTPGGSTTVRFYSQAGDGRLGYFGPSNSGCGLSAQTQWDTAYNSLTAPAGYTDTLRSTYVSSGCLGNSAVNIARGFLPFDTSSLPDNVLITDAKMFINVNTTQNSVNDGNDFISVVQGLQSSPLSLIDTDYTKAGNSLLNPVEGSNRVDISSITPSAYNLWQLNSSGLSWISKTGSTLLALREGHDILNIWAGYNVGQGNRIDAYLSEQTGTTQDPYLEVTYTTQIHCPPLGNIDCQGTVSVGDLSYVISHFGSNDSLSDLNDSGKVNVIDLAILLSNFGQ